MMMRLVRGAGLMLTVLFVTGVAGCMDSTDARESARAEIAREMREHLSEQYRIDFEIGEVDLAADGWVSRPYDRALVEVPGAPGETFWVVRYEKDGEYLYEDGYSLILASDYLREAVEEVAVADFGRAIAHTSVWHVREASPYKTADGVFVPDAFFGDPASTGYKLNIKIGVVDSGGEAEAAAAEHCRSILSTLFREGIWAEQVRFSIRYLSESDYSSLADGTGRSPSDFPTVRRADIYISGSAGADFADIQFDDESYEGFN